jgi:hypothetical protein
MTDEYQPTGAWDQHIYKVVAAGALALILIGTVTYRLLEDWSWVDSLYFSVVAITTVGFGDVTPTTDASKLFTIFYILAGIALITTYLNLRLKRRAVRKQQKS